MCDLELFSEIQSHIVKNFNVKINGILTIVLDLSVYDLLFITHPYGIL